MNLWLPSAPLVKMSVPNSVTLKPRSCAQKLRSGWYVALTSASKTSALLYGWFASPLTRCSFRSTQAVKLASSTAPTSATVRLLISVSRSSQAHRDAHHHRPIARCTGAPDLSEVARRHAPLSRARLGVETAKVREQEGVERSGVDPQGATAERTHAAARHRISQGDAADADERSVLVAPGVSIRRILLGGIGAGVGRRRIGRGPVVHHDVVVTAGHGAEVRAELVLDHEAPARDRHDGEVEGPPVEAIGEAPRPGGEVGAENHLVVLVDQAVAVHVHDPDLAGGLLVLLRFERVLELPDAGELVVVVDLDGGADEPRVARVGLQAARQTHDPIPAPRPGERGAPPA